MTDYRENRQLNDVDKITIFGFVEPEDFLSVYNVMIQVKEKETNENIIDPIEPERSGLFVLEFDLIDNIRQLFERGMIEIVAVDSDNDEEILSRKRITLAEYSKPVGVRLILNGLNRKLQSTSNISNEIITQESVTYLATKLSQLQRVDTKNVKVPRTILRSIQELNELSKFALNVLAGNENAKDELKHVLRSSTSYIPSGLHDGELTTNILPNSTPPELQSFEPCAPTVLVATKVLESAYMIDVSEHNDDMRWTKQAGSYLRNRLREVSLFTNSVDQALHDGLYFSMDDNDLMSPLFSSESLRWNDFVPEYDGTQLPSPCDFIQDYCISVFQEALVSMGQDQWIDLIGSVEEDCICSSYDPATEFIARPKQGKVFPQRIPKSVRFVFGNHIISAFQIVNAQEIRFRIPPNSHTGKVYFEGYRLPQVQVSQQTARICGIPVIPPTTALPAAQISIIYPPVIDSFAPDSGLQPYEACTPVEINWHIRLLDQPSYKSPPDCSGVEVIITDNKGERFERDSFSGSLTVTEAETTTYTIEATSLANGQPCGVATPSSVTIERIKYIWLERVNPTSVEQRSGSGGRIQVKISCPAPEEGLEVHLHSSNVAVLQVPSPIEIRAGSDSSDEIEFTTSADVGCDEEVVITLNAANHEARGGLDFNLYVDPTIQWDTGVAPNVQSGDRFSAVIDTNCVPDDHRAEWLLVPKDQNATVPFLPLIATKVRGQYPEIRFEVTMYPEHEDNLSAGRWDLYLDIPDRDVQAQTLEFVVIEPPQFDISLIGNANQTIELDNMAAYQIEIVGENIVANEALNLSTTGLHTRGISPSFNPHTITLNQGNLVGRSTLSISSISGKTAIGTFPFSIRASGTLATKQIPAVVTISRKQGNFTKVPVIHNSTTCGNVDAIVTGSGQGRIVVFVINTSPQIPNTTVSATFYLISPNCRVGVVIPPLNTRTGPIVNLYNLGFDQTMNPRARKGRELDSIRAFWQQFWFSPDDTLLVVIGRAIIGSTVATHTIGLYDTVRGQKIGATRFISPATLEAADYPENLPPLQDGEIEYNLAIINSVRLTKNNRNKDVVEVTYLGSNGVVDTATISL